VPVPAGHVHHGGTVEREGTPIPPDGAPMIPCLDGAAPGAGRAQGKDLLEGLGDGLEIGGHRHLEGALEIGDPLSLGRGEGDRRRAARQPLALCRGEHCVNGLLQRDARRLETLGDGGALGHDGVDAGGRGVR